MTESTPVQRVAIRRALGWSTLVAVAIALTACVVHRLDVAPIETTTESPVTVTSPVKAHLNDGSTVVFEDGVTVDGDDVVGAGWKYDLALASSTAVASIPLKDVAAMESFATPVASAATGLASYGYIVGGAILALALFGSCPTIYALDAGSAVLEAESFSYSIAPLLEARDVDRLGLKGVIDGVVRLEVRNEALETHYLNHLELVEVLHSPAESVFPNAYGQPIVVGSTVQPAVATDRTGRNVAASIAAADGSAWTTDAAVLERVTLEDHDDHLELEFDIPESADQVALLLRLRNTLLNTVLLYDVMLKGQGIKALDWMGNDLNRIGPALELGRWYAETMGMHVELWQDGRYVEVARIPDQGPIAWKDIAVIVPAPHSNKALIRLSFVADNWAVDWAAVSTEVRDGAPRSIPVARVLGPDASELDDARVRVSAPDESYLFTQPGDKIRLDFNVGAVGEDLRRTFLFAAQGYYIEWLRKDWLHSNTETTFTPSDEALLTALSLWRPRRDSFREQFEATRIPTR